MKDKPILDEVDLQIIAQMSEDAQISYADLGKKIFVSGGTIHVRLNKLRDSGVITGSTLKVNFQGLGYEITAFVGILLTKSSSYNHVIQSLQLIPEVVGANYTTGQYGILVKLMCRDSENLRDVLFNQIGMIAGIHRTESFLSLAEPIQRVPQVIPIES